MRLMDHLPGRVYSGEEHVVDLQNALSGEVESAQKARDDLLRQVVPSTATWGLSRFEREWGIAPDPSKPREQRLALWRAKRRGTGTSTVERIRSVAQSFADGEVEVEETPREYRFAVRVTTEQQAGPNTADMVAAIRAIQPAHLQLNLLLVQNSQGAAHLGASHRWGQTLTVYPHRPDPIYSDANAHIGMTSLWGHMLQIHPKEA